MYFSDEGSSNILDKPFLVKDNGTNLPINDEGIYLEVVKLGDLSVEGAGENYSYRLLQKVNAFISPGISIGFLRYGAYYHVVNKGVENIIKEFTEWEIDGPSSAVLGFLLTGEYKYNDYPISLKDVLLSERFKITPEEQAKIKAKLGIA